MAWAADNGNGTYSNPLFFDEFSDPDLIRVGDTFYLTGTTMHTFPGLPVMTSKDLVNWSFLGYALDVLDFGPEYRLEDGRDIYGQGIWAPCLRYHDGKFYIFTNVNGRFTQVFTATDPAGPWTHHEMKVGLHDLSVLFDDDGKIWVVWGYRDLHIAQLNAELDDLVPGTECTPFGPDSLIGEGAHFYKIDGKYFITSAWYAGRMRMACARADRPNGPYEVNAEISADEAFGLTQGHRLVSHESFEVSPIDPKSDAERIAMHQGGVVQAVDGAWWGFSMMDANSVGRLTCLSPVTWHEGWPFFGLPGNLGRTPRTWLKPASVEQQPISSPYQRNDSLTGPKLREVWQWNHAPVQSQWEVDADGLKLYALPANDFFHARNTLTQRTVGPRSTASVSVDASALGIGDQAGLALLNYPYAWIGVRKTQNGMLLVHVDQRSGIELTLSLASPIVRLSAECDFLNETAVLSCNGEQFGEPVQLIYQLRTFQGVRFGLFAYGDGSGSATFRDFRLDEPSASLREIPYGQRISLTPLGDATLASEFAIPMKVADAGNGRVRLVSHDGKALTVADDRVLFAADDIDDTRQVFQWIEVPRGDILFLSLATSRYLCVRPDGNLAADALGARYDRTNGASFTVTLQS